MEASTNACIRVGCLHDYINILWGATLPPNLLMQDALCTSWRSTTYKNNNVTEKFKHALQCAKIYNYDLPQDIENLSTLLFVVFCIGI
ncbi:hypothetical protein H5410_027980 [Solanum commersonii]|uniref:Uncharacterized protein n=1 Tax=Solanum commersonii TaxID=4109 RepID=A0A9J5Z3G9_SOLCO|nr:hypothetical protein H5410_027980 [Solanum commersonii]